MGCGQSKIGIIYPRKSKRRRGSKRSGHSETDSDEDAEDSDRGVNADESERLKAGKQRQVVSTGPLLAQTEISSSQMDFFRMLDEKIESGPDYDSASEEELALERARLCSLLRDWETASLSTSSGRSAPSTPAPRKPCPQQQPLLPPHMNGELQYLPFHPSRASPVHRQYCPMQPVQQQYHQHNSVVQYRKSRGTYTELA